MTLERVLELVSVVILTLAGVVATVVDVAFSMQGIFSGFIPSIVDSVNPGDCVCSMATLMDFFSDLTLYSSLLMHADCSASKYCSPGQTHSSF